MVIFKSYFIVEDNDKWNFLFGGKDSKKQNKTKQNKTKNKTKQNKTKTKVPSIIVFREVAFSVVAYDNYQYLNQVASRFMGGGCSQI